MLQIFHAGKSIWNITRVSYRTNGVTLATRNLTVSSREFSRQLLFTDLVNRFLACDRQIYIGPRVISRHANIDIHNRKRWKGLYENRYSTDDNPAWTGFGGAIGGTSCKREVALRSLSVTWKKIYLPKNKKKEINSEHVRCDSKTASYFISFISKATSINSFISTSYTMKGNICR